MKAHDELMTMLRSEFQLDVQTVREEQLRDTEAIRKESKMLAERFNTERQETLRTLREKNEGLHRQVDELRSDIDQIAERLRSAEGELLRVHTSEQQHRNTQQNLRLEL